MDAARAEIRLNDLSQLSLIGVLGYDEDLPEDPRLSRTPASEKGSGLMRISTARFGFEWAVLGGTVRERTIAGGSFQGEIWDWLGLRAEGHYAKARTGDEDPFGKIAVDLEHRFENSLSLRVEQYYQSNGYGSIGEFNESILTGIPPALFLGRHYTALGLTYEVSPLLTTDILAILNWIDDSTLLSFYAVYSLSDEAELSPGFSLPVGKPSEGLAIESEFGLLPYTASLEFRIYF